VTALYATMQMLGGVLCAIALIWASRTRHQRRVWRRTRHDTVTAAIVLELEEKVRELEKLTASTVDAR
jgi:hypothetical protein